MNKNILPKGWRAVALQDLFDFKNGLNADKSDYGKGYKFVNVMDVINNMVIMENNIIGSVVADAKKFESFSLSFGDVLFNRTSETQEEIALSAVYMDNKPAVFGGFVIRGRSKTKDLDISFLLFLFQSRHFRKQVMKLGQGAVRANIGQESLNQVILLIPPLSEQKKIASILSTWDWAIEKTEALLKNSEDQLKALMQQLLTGKKRLPGFSEEWKRKKLDEVVKMKSGGTPLSSKEEYYGGSIPWVSIADMTLTGKHIYNTEKTLTQAGLDNSSAALYPKDTVLFAMYASIGECCIAEKELSSSQAILGISCGEELYFEFLYYSLSLLKNKFKRMGQKGSQSNLNAGMVKAFSLLFPPLQEQKAIASVLTAAQKEVDKIKEKLARLKLEKKALMQQLLTGKKRVLDA